MENLTQQQFEDYNGAESLAWRANEAFDIRLDAARSVASISIMMNLGAELPAQRNKELIHGLAAAKKSFSTAQADFELYYDAADALMPARSAFEVSNPAIEPFASESVWGAMSPEQKVKASEVREAMAEQLKDHGVTAESLRVVMHESEKGEKTFTLVHTGNGIDIGAANKDYDKTRSYKSVMAKRFDKLFNVTVGGQKYDVRKGMTATAYDALYEDACVTDGATLPDSGQMAEENNDVWTWTMLTGEDLTAGGYVRVRGVDDGRVDGNVYHPGNDNRALRVRPAVEIV
jgi:hypothetical protein